MKRGILDDDPNATFAEPAQVLANAARESLVPVRSAQVQANASQRKPCDGVGFTVGPDGVSAGEQNLLAVAGLDGEVVEFDPARGQSPHRRESDVHAELFGECVLGFAVRCAAVLAGELQNRPRQRADTHDRDGAGEDATDGLSFQEDHP